MKLLPFVTFSLLIYGSVAPPVTEKKKKEEQDEDDVKQQAIEVEYKKYLQEVVQLLEGDEDFKKKLMEATPEEIKSGNIADHVDGLHHGLRTQLDELKRQELERLRHFAMQQYEHDNGIDSKHLKIPAHLDASNPHTFEVEDLRKLIIHTTKELESADVERKKDFKEYEMQKELKYQEQLKHLDEQNRIAAQKQHEELLQKHNKHAPIHHPGSKDQLEQVWEEQDHMSPENFNPKTFFHLHDLDGNGVWDQVEVKALFKKELDKMYDPNAPEDDLRERFEEMERMREHVFNETDTNRDQLITFQEFLEQTKRKEFEQENNWDPIDQNQHPVYNDEEYKQYARQHEEEIRRLIEQGAIPSAPPGYIPMILPPGQYPPGHGPHTPGMNMPPPVPHPNAIPQAHYYPNAPQGGQGYQPGAVPQGHPNAPPPYPGQQNQQHQYPPDPASYQQQQQQQQNHVGNQQYQPPPQHQPIQSSNDHLPQAQQPIPNAVNNQPPPVATKTETLEHPAVAAAVAPPPQHH